MKKSPVFFASLGLVSSLFLTLPAPVATAQPCPDPGNTFWKNDNLAQQPGLGAASVIPGMCEGEACAAVFDIPPGSPPQEVKRVAVGFGNGFGVSGAQALLNVEIYDGITWSGNTPTLGTKVFDLNADTQLDMQVFTHGINYLDLPVPVTVGNGTDAWVLAFRMNFNLNSTLQTCLVSGANDNFMTDNTGLFGCTAGSKKNLIDTLSAPWQDCSVATVQGFSLCPIFYNGNWLIRACTETAQVCQQDLGLQGQGPAVMSLCGGDLSTGTNANLEIAPVVAGNAIILLGSFAYAPTNVWELQSQLVTIPPIFAIPFVPGAPFVSIPITGGGGPGSLYLQAVVQGVGAPTPSGYYATNALRADFLP